MSKKKKTAKTQAAEVSKLVSITELPATLRVNIQAAINDIEAISFMIRPDDPKRVKDLETLQALLAEVALTVYGPTFADKLKHNPPVIRLETRTKAAATFAGNTAREESGQLAPELVINPNSGLEQIALYMAVNIPLLCNEASGKEAAFFPRAIVEVLRAYGFQTEKDKGYNLVWTLAAESDAAIQLATITSRFSLVWNFERPADKPKTDKPKTTKWACTCGKHKMTTPADEKELPVNCYPPCGFGEKWLRADDKASQEIAKASQPLKLNVRPWQAPLALDMRPQA